MIKFGPSGNSDSFFAAGYKHSEDAARFVGGMGLDLYEYSFGRGILLGNEKAAKIGEAFREANVEISVHAPYYINFSGEEEGIAKSYGYILDSARAAGLMGGERIVFHPASQGKAERGVAVAMCLDRLKVLRDKIYEAGLDKFVYCPETMGKLRQIGTIEEIAEFCKVDKIFMPCIDFGHVNAREGGSLRTADDYKARLEYMIDVLGYERMKHFHAHFSKIEYGDKGEIRHLTFADDKYGPEFEPLLVALEDLRLEPHIVCESNGTQAEDALKMKEYTAKN